MPVRFRHSSDWPDAGWFPEAENRKSGEAESGTYEYAAAEARRKNMVIRKAEERDMEALLSIYNYEVEHGAVSYTHLDVYKRQL